MTELARLVSVNVGLPRDIEWKGRTVHTGIWKEPVSGRCRVRRLNLDGDGQGDLGGHGGEQRAVFVYQLGSYRHWAKQLARTDLVPGQFGENFTVEGLDDDVACIGDRYRIGSALFEISQPRVTCYRVGIRLNEPRMAALLTGSGRPGFYFRVLEEGEVGAGDEIVKVAEGKERMTVATINALLYSPAHPPELLERALKIDALSPGWRGSFEELLRSGKKSGPASGFERREVVAIESESADVLSFTMRDVPSALPGQYVVLRIHPTDGPTLYRSYSLSGPHRISVKIEGAAGRYLREHVRVGDTLEVSAPRGSFTLQPGERPVVLLSAGIGATPVLAMLQSLATEKSTRPVLWLHGATDAQHHSFAEEVRRLVRELPHGRSFVCYSRPAASDTDFDATGHLSAAVLRDVGVPPDADVYLCGPNRFMDDMKAALANLGVNRVHVEIFNGGESMTPGVVRAVKRAPHLPEHTAGTGPLISFARSGISVRWDASAYESILELAEACDVPVRWSCRTGVCHNCECSLVSGAVAYGPEPLDRPAEGNALICCSRPTDDVVIDL